jgi:hypothetical protein
MEVCNGTVRYWGIQWNGLWEEEFCGSELQHTALHPTAHWMYWTGPPPNCSNFKQNSQPHSCICFCYCHTRRELLDRLAAHNQVKCKHTVNSNHGSYISITAFIRLLSQIKTHHNIICEIMRKSFMHNDILVFTWLIQRSIHVLHLDTSNQSSQVRKTSKAMYV